jgi:hypothetical protein
MMKARPIIFSSQMVQSILDGRKTQTRRVIKPQPEVSAEGYLMGDWLNKPLGGLLLPKLQDIAIHCPLGEIGDVLWVRETYICGLGVGGCIDGNVKKPIDVIYRADDGPNERTAGPWKSPIFMPRSASRITLEITNIRVERLQDISREDAIAEGVRTIEDAIKDGYTWCDGPRRGYMIQWDIINGSGSWNLNPWVWVIEFRRM